MEIQHFADEHTLVFNEVLIGHYCTCNGCNEQIPEKGLRYSCRKCNFDLHPSCAKLPRELQHPLHSKHPLILHKTPPYDAQTCTCSFCNLPCKRFVYHCPLCKFDVDIKCASLPLTFEVEIHEHHLILLRKLISFICDFCGIEGKGLPYLCGECGFWVHQKCASLPRMVKHLRHRHPLNFTYSIKEDHSEHRLCQLCVKKVDTNYKVYYCSSCDYVAHLDCATDKNGIDENFMRESKGKEPTESTNMLKYEDSELGELINELSNSVQKTKMSPFKKSVVKGSNSKGKESVIDVDSFTPKSKKTQSSTGFYDANKFRSYAVFQAYESYFKDAPLLVERVIEQASLLDTNIPKWFATKDWNFLLTNFDETYEQMVKEFYANAIFEGDELKCWVRGKDFTVTPSYLAIILRINRPMFPKPLVYDDLNPEEDVLRETLGENLEFSSNGKSISVASLSPKLRLLTTIMFHNLYPLSSTGYMNLGQALFLHDLINDEEIDICSHIFHILSKTAKRTASKNCLPFCCLISKILKLKDVHPLEDEYPYPQQSPINIYTLNASISHFRKGAKQESNAPHDSSSSSSHPYDEKLDNIMSSVQEISTKLSKLASIMNTQHTRFNTKFTSLQTQLDQIQRKL